MSILPWLLLIPALGALLVALLPKARGQAAAYLALAISLIPLAITAYLLANFQFGPTAKLWQFTLHQAWLPEFGVSLSLGLDAISLWLVVLTAVLTPISILASFNYIKDRRPEFYAWMLLLHAGMLGVFCARDVLLFYFFFELTLIPMFFIIGLWGGAERRKAAGKFFLFTFTASVLTLASLIYLAYTRYQFQLQADPINAALSFGMDDLYKFGQSGQLAQITIPVFGLFSIPMPYILFFGLLAGFAAKVPLFPFHTWLPLAHTEAPTAGSVILAGVLLKLGTYGMLRFVLPLLPEATRLFAPGIAGVCIVGIVYGALVSWVQGDMKKLIAYSSVSHLGFCVLGMFALTATGLTGSIMYMINHGLSTGALFLVVGMFYERYHTRQMDDMSGLVRRLPALGFFTVFFVFSSVALPGLNGFVSEFLVLLGTFISGGSSPAGVPYGGNLGPWFAVPAALGVILGAVYLLYWAGRVVFGPLKEPAIDHDNADDEHAVHAPTKDLSLREWLVLTPLAILILAIGVYPKPMLDSLQPPVQNVMTTVSGSAAGH